eukprot:COSAG05_NODE_9820_length_599_cov_0.630000_1_plen_154_part_01
MPTPDPTQDHSREELLQMRAASDAAGTNHSEWMEWADKYGDAGYSSNIVVPHLARERGNKAWLCEKVLPPDDWEILYKSLCAQYMGTHSFIFCGSVRGFAGAAVGPGRLRPHCARAHAEGAELPAVHGRLRHLRHGQHRLAGTSLPSSNPIFLP